VLGVELKNVSKDYDGTHRAVRGVTLTVQPGEFFTLLGPSGCGKTTTLRMIAGLEAPTLGEVWIGGRNCTDEHPRDRRVALVFQSYALYPHMSVHGNIALNLKIEGVAKPEIEQRVKTITRSLQIDHLLPRRPKNLSGGERQRVALARALVRNPEVLLMDEPLSNLDLKLREHMRTELRRLHDEYGHTVICVTHDQAEAMTMSDRIAVMKDGLVEQIGTAEEVYCKPRNTFVASFLGTPSVNLIPGRLDAVAANFSSSRDVAEKLPVALGDGAAGHARPVLIGVRPEDVLIGGTGDWTIDGTVRLVEPIGAHKLLFMDIGIERGPTTRIVALVSSHESYRTSDRIPISFRHGRVMVFDATSEELLGFAQEGAGDREGST
jgi:ABC-type sugar transport system ATPase subunit